LVVGQATNNGAENGILIEKNLKINVGCWIRWYAGDVQARIIWLLL
jgi:hypothetical protein